MSEVRKAREKVTAELFTPEWMVKGMLDKAHQYDQYLYHKTFLDNACGNGNLLIEVLKRKLETMEPLQALSTIYGIDFMEDNVIECRDRLLSVLDPQLMDMQCIQYAMEIVNNNIVHANALEFNYNKQFDVIITNPPYSTKRDISFKKSKTIWHKFIELDMTLLKDNGMLIAITPSGWRNVDGFYKKVQKELYKNNICYIEMHDTKDGQKSFGASTRYDIYIVQKQPYNGFTEVIDQDGIVHRVELKRWFEFGNDEGFLPNGRFDEIWNYLDHEVEHEN